MTRTWLAGPSIHDLCICETRFLRSHPTDSQRQTNLHTGHTPRLRKLFLALPGRLAADNALLYGALLYGRLVLRAVRARWSKESAKHPAAISPPQRLGVRSREGAAKLTFPYESHTTPCRSNPQRQLVASSCCSQLTSIRLPRAFAQSSHPDNAEVSARYGCTAAPIPS